MDAARKSPRAASCGSNGRTRTTTRAPAPEIGFRILLVAATATVVLPMLLNGRRRGRPPFSVARSVYLSFYVYPAPTSASPALLPFPLHT